MKHKSFILISSLLISTNVFALEIDEKLTLRFLNVSSTQRTVLTNRGAEDGLVIGDHAKFFITSGVVARGVVEKVSPTRSVWSLYRIVDSNEIIQDKVLNIKISTPARITDDPSRSLKELGIPGAGTDAVMRTRGDDLSLDDYESDELQEMTPRESSAQMKRFNRTSSKANVDPKRISKVDGIPLAQSFSSSASSWEAFGTIYLNSMSGSSTSDTEDSGLTSDIVTNSSMALSAGVEKYFFHSDGIFADLSLLAFINKKSIETGESVTSKTDTFEFGVGANYHFYNPARALNKPIGYLAVTAGMGAATSTSSVLVNGEMEDESVDGSTSFFSLGMGVKYILGNGIGFRALLDYYATNESYEYDDETVTKTLAGPRIQLGLSYRF